MLGSLIFTAVVASAATPFQWHGFFSQTFSTLDDDITYNDITTDEVDYVAGTYAGIQLTYKYNQQTQFVTQLVANVQEDFKTSFDWAYVQHETQQNHIWRIGRMRMRNFLHSDHLNVSYAYPWVTPPLEIYNTIPVKNLQGLTYEFNKQYDQWHISWQTMFGGLSERVTGGSLVGETAQLKDVFGSNVQFSSEQFLIHMSYLQGQFHFEQQPDTFVLIQNSLGGLGLQQYADDFDGTAYREGHFFGLGATYSVANYEISAEYTRRELESIYSDIDSYNFTVSRYFDDILPYLAYSMIETIDTEERKYGNPQFDAQLQRDLQSDQESWTLGVRYDFQASMAVNAEISRIESKNGAKGFFDRPTDRPVNVLKLSYSTVF